MADAAFTWGTTRGRKRALRLRREGLCFPQSGFLAARAEGFLFPEERQNGAFPTGVDSAPSVRTGKDSVTCPQFPSPGRSLQGSPGARRTSSGPPGFPSGGERPEAGLHSSHQPSHYVTGAPWVGVESCWHEQNQARLAYPEPSGHMAQLQLQEDGGLEPPVGTAQ